MSTAYTFECKKEFCNMCKFMVNKCMYHTMRGLLDHKSEVANLTIVYPTAFTMFLPVFTENPRSFYLNKGLIFAGLSVITI